MAGALADWTMPVPRDDGMAFPVFGRDGDTLYLPGSLAIADERAGVPAFRLTAFRPAVPTDTDRGFSLLELRLKPVFPASAEGDPGAQYAEVARGFLKLTPADAIASQTAPAPDPESLDWAGIGLARLSIPLDAQAAILVEGVLDDGPLPYMATAYIEVDGVSPRLAATVKVDGRKLVAALRSTAGPALSLSRDQILDFVRLDPASTGLAVTLTEAEAVPGALANALADRIRVRFGAYAMAGNDGPAAIRLPASDDDVPEELAWNLAEELTAPRPFVLGFDPFSEARALARAGGKDRLVTRVVTPPLSLGFYRLLIEAILPEHPVGLGLLAVNLRFPPHPPGRPQEIRRSVPLAAGAPGQTMDLRLSPGETLSWKASALAMVEQSNGLSRLSSPEREGLGGRVLFAAADLPVRFVEMELAPALARIAALDIRLSGTAGIAAVETGCRLDAAQPVAAVTLPRAVVEATVRAVASEAAGSGQIALADRPLGDQRYDVTDVPGFGPRSVAIDIDFTDGATLAALEFKREIDGDEESPVLKVLTPAHPSDTVTWLAANPFRPGLLWRRRPMGEAAPEPWSGPLDGSAPLTLSWAAMAGATS